MKKEEVMVTKTPREDTGRREKWLWSVEQPSIQEQADCLRRSHWATQGIGTIRNLPDAPHQVLLGVLSILSYASDVALSLYIFHIPSAELRRGWQCMELASLLSLSGTFSPWKLANLQTGTFFKNLLGNPNRRSRDQCSETSFCGFSL